MDRERLLKLKDRLESLDKAIDEIVTQGVSYSLQGSHSVTRANLSDLYKQRKALLMEARSIMYPDSNSGGIVKVRFV